jgi:uncharacterized membrane protein YdjX (TVP38/TMEM64 family)
MTLSSYAMLYSPCTPLEMVPGFLFGITTGTIVSVSGKMLGNAIAIYVVRKYFKDWANEYLCQFKTFRVVEVLVRKGGLWPILLVRLMWMPAAIKNYGLAVLDVPISRILFCAFITAIPFAIIWNYIGHSCKNLLEIFDGRQSNKISNIIPSEYKLPFFLISCIATIYIIYHGRKEWKEAVKQVNLEDEKKKNSKKYE